MKAAFGILCCGMLKFDRDEETDLPKKASRPLQSIPVCAVRGRETSSNGAGTSTLSLCHSLKSLPEFHALEDIDEDSDVPMDEGEVPQAGTSPFLLAATRSRLSRMASADLPEIPSHNLTVNLDRTATEPAILLTTRSMRHSPHWPLPKRTRLGLVSASPSPHQPPALSVTPSMELRQAAAGRIREVAAMYAERARVSRERGAQSLREVEAEKERRRANAKMTSVKRAKSMQLYLIKDRSNALQKHGITTPLQPQTFDPRRLSEPYSPKQRASLWTPRFSRSASSRLAYLRIENQPDNSTLTDP
jgi:hypothetical protein